MHRFVCWFEQKSPVGASLLAKAVGRSTSMLPETPPSRASPLPQGSSAHTKPCPFAIGRQNIMNNCACCGVLITSTLHCAWPGAT
ncbi:hypothetical protein C1X64_16975 [Pseudomonas sp. GW456-E7]|nr:hypothetical protein C1X64_16975 [Pseudomonas sp. GW456-E7]